MIPSPTPTIEALPTGGHRIRWARQDGVTYTETNHRSRSAYEAWREAERFFRLVGCEGVPNFRA